MWLHQQIIRMRWAYIFCCLRFTRGRGRQSPHTRCNELPSTESLDQFTLFEPLDRSSGRLVSNELPDRSSSAGQPSLPSRSDPDHRYSTSQNDHDRDWEITTFPIQETDCDGLQHNVTFFKRRSQEIMIKNSAAPEFANECHVPVQEVRDDMHDLELSRRALNLTDKNQQTVTLQANSRLGSDDDTRPESDEGLLQISRTVHNMNSTSLSSLKDNGIKCPLLDDITSNTYDHNGGELISKYGDIKIIIPVDAIKVGDHVKICTSSDLYGPFKLLLHCRDYLASPFYWIGVSESYRFQKPVQVEIEHFGKATAADSYHLLTCEDDDESYTMRPVDYDLSFTVRGDGISLCSFQTDHFCSYCLFHDGKGTMQNKIGAFYLKPNKIQNINHAVQIWFSLNISRCLKRNEELYTKEDMTLDRHCSCTFEVSSGKSSTSYFVLEYKAAVEGWHINHWRHKEIKTKDINFYNHYKNMEELKTSEEMSQFPPRFIVNVTRGSKCNADLYTTTSVTLYNKKEKAKSMESVFFHLCVPLLVKYTTKHITEAHAQCFIDDHHCNENKPNMKDLIEYIDDISDSWEKIAIHLELGNKISTINRDHQSTSNKCIYMFITWLERTTEPCWCNIIQSLHKVGLFSVAEKAKTHLKVRESALPSKDDQIKLKELTTLLNDIPECSLRSFILHLFSHKAVKGVIKDIKHSSRNWENKIKIICEAFLKQKCPSWTKVYNALEKAKCNDLAEYIKEWFL